MIRIRPQKRMSCKTVDERIRKMLEKCQENPEYCTKPTPNSFTKRATNESDKPKVITRLLDQIRASIPLQSWLTDRDEGQTNFSSLATDGHGEEVTAQPQLENGFWRMDADGTESTDSIPSLHATNTRTLLPGQRPEKRSSRLNTLLICC